MRSTLIMLISAVVVSAIECLGQGFINLDFDSAGIALLSTTNGAYLPVATALPGWTAFAGTNQISEIKFNPSSNVPLPPIAFFGEANGTGILQGNFDLRLNDGSISQTGLVPANAVSLLFDQGSSSSQPFTVLLNSQDLTCVVVANAVDSLGVPYVIYGADISTFAGQDEALTFSTPGFGLLDDIQFSSSTVPEPGSLALLALGGGGFIYTRVRKQE